MRVQLLNFWQKTFAFQVHVDSTNCNYHDFSDHSITSTIGIDNFTYFLINHHYKIVNPWGDCIPWIDSRVALSSITGEKWLLSLGFPRLCGSCWSRIQWWLNLTANWTNAVARRNTRNHSQHICDEQRGLVNTRGAAGRTGDKLWITCNFRPDAWEHLKFL
jgi:hypothetical protein